MRFLVIQDHKENRKKCSLTPLERLPGVTFVRLPQPSADPRKAQVPSGVLLALEAPPLTREDAALAAGEGCITVLDSTWARLPRLLKRIEPAKEARVELRSIPPGVRTAYPRTSKLYEDPAAGLASVEALFLATVILGQPRLDFLQGYRWAEQFLRLNGLLDLLDLLPPPGNASLSRGMLGG
ncbi:MAG: hypothetical protein HY721_14025 [Planctomycetes bacterium]|nr:hypothetical protein [Planctomycetota bacterium]